MKPLLQNVTSVISAGMAVVQILVLGTNKISKITWRKIRRNNDRFCDKDELNPYDFELNDYDLKRRYGNS